MVKILSNHPWIFIYCFAIVKLLGLIIYKISVVHSLGGWNSTECDVSLVRACVHIISWWVAHSRSTAGERSHGEKGSQEPGRGLLCSFVTTLRWELVRFQENYLNPPKSDEPPPTFCGLRLLQTPLSKGRPHFLQGLTFWRPHSFHD